MTTVAKKRIPKPGTGAGKAPDGPVGSMDSGRPLTPLRQGALWNAKPLRYQELDVANTTPLTRTEPVNAMASAAATILVVDDELRNRTLLEALLQPEGYLTRTAANGKEALASIAQSAPDLILLDVMMPGMNGYQVATTLKASPVTASIPIILVTGQIDRNARLAGLDCGAEEFLTKPVDRAELWLRVRNLLRLKALSDFHKSHSESLLLQVQASTIDLQTFRAAMDATTDAILLVSRASMLLVDVNVTACKMFGYTRDEFLSLDPAQLGAITPPDLEAACDAIIKGHVASELTETRIRRKDGADVQVEVHRHAYRFGPDWIIVCVLHDITERKEAESRLSHMAHHDALTGLPNRTLSHETLEEALALASIRGSQVAVLCVDLDNFKIVNDTLGHAAGDLLLGQFSNRLLQVVPIRDTVGRLGGDEFALILLMEDAREGAIATANKICTAMREPFNLFGREMVVTASIGISIFPDDASDPATLMQYADTAMCRAKQVGRNTYRFFTTQINSELMARNVLETDVRRAVENGEFILHYQPKVRLNTGSICGLEALLRWQRPGYGLVSPDIFIPILEETGLIVRVGSWIIATACRQIGLWRRSSIGPVAVSVNVSACQFIEGNLYGDISKALSDNDIAPELLELELTESSLMENAERTIANMQSLRNLGVKLSIDDFGTGYSSLAYLRHFPVNHLKLDIAFVRNITNNLEDAAIALTIIRLAHTLNLEVIAEGVETATQLAHLQRNGCDHIQGFYFSQALPVAELEQILREGKRLSETDDCARTPKKGMRLLSRRPHVLEL